MDTTILQQKQNKKNVWILLFGTTGKLKKMQIALNLCILISFEQ